MNEPMLTEPECDLLTAAVLVGATGENPTTDEEVAKVIEWAEGVRVDVLVLTMLLEGKVRARFDDELKLFALSDDQREWMEHARDVLA